jgi:elongation factor P
MSQLNALDLRKGHLVDYQGRMCTVSDWSIMRNDRRQYVYVTLKDLRTGRVQELKEHGDTKFDVLENEKIDLTHSYSDGPEEVFYDHEGGEHRCQAEAAQDALRWKCDAYVGFLVNGTLVSVSTPSSVVAVVAETSPSIKGVQGGLKDAILDNGIKVRVGQMVNVGDRVKIDPVTLEFRDRA